MEAREMKTRKRSESKKRSLNFYNHMFFADLPMSRRSCEIFINYIKIRKVKEELKEKLYDV